MKVLFIDTHGDGIDVDLATRSRSHGHEVRAWQSTFEGTDKPLPYGEGIVNLIRDWEESMDWAELIVLNGNRRYHSQLAPYIGKGYPILGTNPKGAELELDRAAGQQLLERLKVPTIPYTVAGSAEEAVAQVKKGDKPVVLKPWGGAMDKAMTFVADSAEDAAWVLRKWEREGRFKGQLMLQERVEGIEVGISGMFGPGGWCEALEESFEHKKLMPGNHGPNTGEMGTVIRHTTDSELFKRVLEPLGEYLHQINYIGDCAVNCIIDKGGTPWPLEFTMRWGYPDLSLRLEALKVDPIEFMAALLKGEDRFIVSPDPVVGVVLAHGTFPGEDDPSGCNVGYPIECEESERLHWQMVKRGAIPTLDGERRGLVTAGNYVGVATARGRTVQAAAKAAYKAAEGVHWPGDIMIRNDIGARLESELPKLHALGYCLGLRYG